MSDLLDKPRGASDRIMLALAEELYVLEGADQSKSEAYCRKRFLELMVAKHEEYLVYRKKAFNALLALERLGITTREEEE